MVWGAAFDLEHTSSVIRVYDDVNMTILESLLWMPRKSGIYILGGGLSGERGRLGSYSWTAKFFSSKASRTRFFVSIVSIRYSTNSLSL